MDQGHHCATNLHCLTGLKCGGIVYFFLPILFSKLCVWMWPPYLTTFIILTLDFQGQILKETISQEWGGRLTWDDMDVSWTFKTMVVSFGWVGGWSELALTQQSKLKLLLPRRRGCNHKSKILKFMSRIDIFGHSYEIISRGMPYDR